MLQFKINDDAFEKEIHQLIVGKIKHVLRNDKLIQELIEDTVKGVIESKVNHFLGDTLNNQMLSNRLDKAINNSVGITSEKIRNQIISSTKKLIKETKLYQDMLKEKNEEIIKELLKI